MSEYITIKRTELEQTLEALRFYADCSHQVTLTGFKNGSRIDWDQERDRLEKAGYRFSHENHNSTEEYVENGGRAQCALNNLEEALALAEKMEPVAVVRSVVGPGDDGVRIKWLRGFPQIGDRLYTAPPQRPSLTEEEIHHATRHCGVSKYTATNIARAVERKMRGEV